MMFRFTRGFHAMKALPQELKKNVFPFELLNLKIGKFKQVSLHPNSDNMYVSQVDLGANCVKQICSGLRHFIPREELEGQLCVVVDNMKKSKLRGEVSEAMVLCGESLGTENRAAVVELCHPNLRGKDAGMLNELIGKQVVITAGQGITSRKLKPKEWEDISSRLHTNDRGEVVYDENGQEQVLTVLTANEASFSHNGELSAKRK